MSKVQKCCSTNLSSTHFEIWFSKKVVSFQPVRNLLRGLHRVPQYESVRNVPAAQLRAHVRHVPLRVLVILDGAPVVARAEIESKFSVEATNAVVVSLANLKWFRITFFKYFICAPNLATFFLQCTRIRTNGHVVSSLVPQPLDHGSSPNFFISFDSYSHHSYFYKLCLSWSKLVRILIKTI